MSQGPLKVSCIQMRSGASIERNSETMAELVYEASKSGAVYVQTPEMTGILQRNRRALFESIVAEDDDVLLIKASKLARDLRLWLHVGSTAVKLGPAQAANRSVLFSPTGAKVAVYDKIHMFDVDLGKGERWRESAVYRPGNTSKVVNMGSAHLGMSICYDLRFPGLYQAMAHSGANVMSCPSAFTKPTGQAHWKVLLQARAIETGSFVVASAQGGQHEDGRMTYGHSMIVDPWGGIVAELDHDEPGVLTGTIDLTMVKDARKKIPNLSNRQEFSVELVEPVGEPA